MDDELKASRAEYRAVSGKAPGPRWDLETILAKTEEARNASPADPDFEPESEPEAPILDTPAPSSVRVMLLCDHVFLPKDPTSSEWRTSSDTVRYDGETDKRRTKLDVHPDLAAFLQDRKQAEILD